MKVLFRGVFAVVVALATILAFPRRAEATMCTMTASSGGDGTFTVVNESGQTVDQATGTPGAYAAYMYFQHPAGCTLASGATLYVEIDYLDVSGEGPDASATDLPASDEGNIGLQYDAKATLGNAFQSAAFVLNAAILNTGALKTAVSRLDSASFDLDENGGNDLRLVQGGTFQLNVVQVRVSDQPTALYTQDTSFVGPYTGPAYAGGTPVDASTLTGKLVCGYQGWYGAPGDEDNLGWSHWSSSGFSLTTSTLQIDPWPDLSEYTPAEQFPVSGFTYPDGGSALLFSSDVSRTVLRHFQWMEAWNIDGVGVQRFVVSLPNLPLDRILTNVRTAANETGRVYYVEYDMSGMTEADIVPTMTADWHYLVDTLKLTADTRYLHQNGLPVVGIFGFFPSRFSSTTANAILDIFGSGAGTYQAFVQGAGDWTWRTSWAADWITMLYRMGAWQPWNTGNTTGATPNYASTGYWSADQTQLQAQHVMYVPQIYPGTSSVNRDQSTPGTGLPRLAGTVLWDQFVAASSISAASAFLGMFDEVSEGTQIVKVTNAPPVQAPNTVTYEGMPSDAYLCFTSQGSRMLKGTIPSSTPLPNCPAMTQPTIPDPIAPLNGDAVAGPVQFSWTAALALAGGGSLTTYDTWIDGTVQSTSSLSLGATSSLAPGTHVWRVRAVNSLGNDGGWSVAQTFTVTSGQGDGGGGGEMDAATATDAGLSPDGSSGSSSGPTDSGSGGGTSASSTGSSGCSCVQAPARGGKTSPWAWLAAGSAVAFARRRRRRPCLSESRPGSASSRSPCGS